MSESGLCQAAALAGVHGALLNNGVPRQNVTQAQCDWPQINKTPVFGHREKLELFCTQISGPDIPSGGREILLLYNINPTRVLGSTVLAISSFSSVFPEGMILYLPLVQGEAWGSNPAAEVLSAPECGQQGFPSSPTTGGFFCSAFCSFTAYPSCAGRAKLSIRVLCAVLSYLSGLITQLLTGFLPQVIILAVYLIFYQDLAFLVFLLLFCCWCCFVFWRRMGTIVSKEASCLE